MPTLADHRARGARALILLHDRELRAFVTVWQRARQAGLELPASDDPDYASLQTLAWHVLACARGYMVWCCEVLQLPAPPIPPCPGAVDLGGRIENYTDEVLAGWRSPLAAVTEQALGTVADSRWGTPYCIDAMLEHAVMHPLRHRFQLDELLQASGTDDPQRTARS